MKGKSNSKNIIKNENDLNNNNDNNNSQSSGKEGVVNISQLS